MHRTEIQLHSTLAVASGTRLFTQARVISITQRSADIPPLQAILPPNIRNLNLSNIILRLRLQLLEQENNTETPLAPDGYLPNTVSSSFEV